MMTLHYFKGSQCSACIALLPKVKQLLKKYPNVKLHIIDVEHQRELAASFNIFSIPAIVVTIDEKTYFQEAGIFSVQTLDEKLNRLYYLCY